MSASLKKEQGNRKEFAMNTDPQTIEKITATIHGTISGQVAIGSGNIQTATVQAATPPNTEELESLRQMLAKLKERVSAEAPDEKKEAALERVNELEEAVSSDKP